MRFRLTLLRFKPAQRRNETVSASSTSNGRGFATRNLHRTLYPFSKIDGLLKLGIGGEIPSRELKESREESVEWGIVSKIIWTIESSPRNGFRIVEKIETPKSPRFSLKSHRSSPKPERKDLLRCRGILELSREGKGRRQTLSPETVRKIGAAKAGVTSGWTRARN